MTDLRNDLSSDTEFTASMERIQELAKKYKMPLAGFVYEHTIADKFKVGYRMTASATDKYGLVHGIEKSLETGRQMVEQAKREIAGIGVESGEI